MFPWSKTNRCEEKFVPVCRTRISEEIFDFVLEGTDHPVVDKQGHSEEEKRIKELFYPELPEEPKHEVQKDTAQKLKFRITPFPTTKVEEDSVSEPKKARKHRKRKPKKQRRQPQHTREELQENGIAIPNGGEASRRGVLVHLCESSDSFEERLLLLTTRTQISESPELIFDMDI